MLCTWGYMQSLITQTFGKLDLSGSPSDLSSDQGTSGANPTVVSAKPIFSFYVFSRS